MKHSRRVVITGMGAITPLGHTPKDLYQNQLEGKSGAGPIFRFDARIEKKWTWNNGFWLSLVLEGLNVTGSTETVSQECTDSGCKKNNLGPIIIPALGVEGGI